LGTAESEALVDGCIARDRPSTVIYQRSAKGATNKLCSCARHRKHKFEGLNWLASLNIGQIDRHNELFARRHIH
jgi:hypothetical protein